MSRPSTKPAWPYLASEPSGHLARVGDGLPERRKHGDFFCYRDLFFAGVMEIHKV